MRAVVLTALALAVGCQPATEQAGPLEGAWQTTEVSFTSPDSSWTETSLQPSLFVFAKQHYSIMLVPGTEPRSLFAGDEPTFGSFEPTDAEKLAAYDSFIANSGTYQVSGSTLTARPMVAKNPNFMSGGSLAFTYQIEGDTLRLTFTPPWATDAEERVTLVRLE